MGPFKEWVEGFSGKSPMGHGRKKKVYPHPLFPNRIVGVYRDRKDLPPPLPNHIPPPSLESLERIKHVTWIAKLLFKDRVATVTKVVNTYDKDGTLPVIVKEEIEGEEFSYSDNETLVEQVKELVREFREIGLYADDRAQNYKVVNDPTPENPYQKKIVYIDDVELGKSKEESLLRLKQAIETRLSGEEKDRALVYFSRLSTP